MSEPDAYDVGFQARLTGLAETENPYDDDTDEFLIWNDGWMAADRWDR